jgi:hypothetical protein
MANQPAEANMSRKPPTAIHAEDVKEANITINPTMNPAIASLRLGRNFDRNDASATERASSGSSS